MTNNENQFTVITRVIGKDELIFQFTDYSCWIFRVNPRANFGRKAIHYFTFKDEQEKALKFNTYLINYKAGQERKEELRKQRLAEQKRKREELVANIKIGDLFHRSRGYDMTHNDFYQVTAIKGKKIFARPIASKTTSGDGGFTGEERPVKDAFIGEEQGYIISPYGGIKVCDYAHAYLSERDHDYYFNYVD